MDPTEHRKLVLGLERIGAWLTGLTGLQVRFDAIGRPSADLVNNIIHLKVIHLDSRVPVVEVLGDTHHELGHIVVDAVHGQVGRAFGIESSIMLFDKLAKSLAYGPVQQSRVFEVFNAIGDSRQERLYCRYYPGAKYYLYECAKSIWGRKGYWGADNKRLDFLLASNLTTSFFGSEIGVPRLWEQVVGGDWSDSLMDRMPQWLDGYFSALVDDGVLEKVAKLHLWTWRMFTATYDDARTFIKFIFDLDVKLEDVFEEECGQDLEDFSLGSDPSDDQEASDGDESETDGSGGDGKDEDDGSDEEDSNEDDENVEYSAGDEPGGEVDTSNPEIFDEKEVRDWLSNQYDLPQTVYDWEKLDNSFRLRATVEKLLNDLLGGMETNETIVIDPKLPYPEYQCPYSDSQLNAKARHVSSKVLRALQARRVTYEIPDQEEGFIDPDGLHKLITQSSDDFFYQEQVCNLPESTDTVVSFLVDISISMDQVPDNLLGQVLYLLGETISCLQLPFEVTFFHSQYQVIKRFRDSWARRRCYATMCHPQGGTTMAPPIRRAVEELRKRPESRKLLFIITDGDPHDEEDVLTAVSLAVNHHIEIVSFNYGTISGIFRDGVSFHKFDQMISKLILVLDQFFRGKRISVIDQDYLEKKRARR